MNQLFVRNLLAGAFLALGTINYANAFEPLTTFPLLGDDEGSASQFNQDFDIDAPGYELVDEPVFICAVETNPTDATKVRVRVIYRLRFRSGIDGAELFQTGNMSLLSGYFPDPFNSANYTGTPGSGEISLHNVYLSPSAEDGLWQNDRTWNLQNSVNASENRDDALCDGFPDFGRIGVGISAVPEQSRTLIFSDEISGAYAPKNDPSSSFEGYQGQGVTSVGQFKVFGIEVSSGSQSKGNILYSKAYNPGHIWNEATNRWGIDAEASVMGPLLANGGDGFRVNERKPASNPDFNVNRVRTFNARTGAQEGATLTFATKD